MQHRLCLARRMPRADLEWKLEKPGYVTLERSTFVIFRSRNPRIDVQLDEEGKTPPGMMSERMG